MTAKMTTSFFRILKLFSKFIAFSNILSPGLTVAIRFSEIKNAVPFGKVRRLFYFFSSFSSRKYWE